MRDELNRLLSQLPPRLPVQPRKGSVIDVHHIKFIQAQPLGDKLVGELLEPIICHQAVNFRRHDSS